MHALTPSDRVVLLHGIIRKASSMTPVEEALKQQGYATLNLDYPSTTKCLEEIAEIIHPAIAAFNASAEGNLHFVTHSMGGLVARVYLAGHRPGNLGRVVMLAPPNKGSEIADLLGSFWFYRKLFGPAGQQLSRRAACALPEPDYPVGVIAGSRSLYPLSSLLLPGGNDGRVSLEGTRIAPDAPWMSVPAPHPTIMRHAIVHAAVQSFLATGHFPVEGASEGS